MTRPYSIATTCIQRCENRLYEMQRTCDPIQPLTPFDGSFGASSNFALCYAVAEKSAIYTGHNLNKMNSSDRVEFISRQYSCPNDDGVDFKGSIPNDKFIQFINLLWRTHCKNFN